MPKHANKPPRKRRKPLTVAHLDAKVKAARPDVRPLTDEQMAHRLGLASLGDAPVTLDGITWQRSGMGEWARWHPAPPSLTELQP